MSRFLTEEEQQFIRDYHLKLSMKDIAAKLNRSPTTIRRFKELEGIVTPKDIVTSFKSHLFTKENYSKLHKNRDVHVWTEQEEDYLRKHYANTCTKLLSKELNQPEKKLSTKANELGLRKSIEYLEKKRKEFIPSENFKKHSYKKGSEPFHKGKKMIDVLSPESYQKFNNRGGKFQKGQDPVNRKPIGSLFQRSTDNVTYIKVSQSGKHNNDWVIYSRYLYEKNIGKIPKGFVVRFKDDDNTNFNLENLYLFPKSSLPEENKYKSRLDIKTLQHFREVLIIKGKVKILSNERNRE